MVAIDLYGTHSEAIAYCVTRTRGPVVELGSGWYSTPLLHGLCEGLGRELITVDDDRVWLENFRPWATETHSLVLDERCAVPIEGASVVFVDHDSPIRTRADSVLEAKEAGTEIVICHDTWKRHGNPSFVFTGGFQEALNAFTYRRDWDIQGTGEFWPEGRAPTSAMSDVHPLT